MQSVCTSENAKWNSLLKTLSDWCALLLHWNQHRSYNMQARYINFVIASFIYVIHSLGVSPRETTYNPRRHSRICFCCDLRFTKTIFRLEAFWLIKYKKWSRYSLQNLYTCEWKVVNFQLTAFDWLFSPHFHSHKEITPNVNVNAFHTKCTFAIVQSVLTSENAKCVD